MKYCPHCGAELNDNAAFCLGCGAKIGTFEMKDPTDHTEEFDKADIKENKLYAILPYLLGALGVIIAHLLAKDSPYVQFHIKQALKLLICGALTTIATVTLCWTCIVRCAGILASCTLLVLTVIAFEQVCMGKAKEPAIIRSINFLR